MCLHHLNSQAHTGTHLLQPLQTMMSVRTTVFDCLVFFQSKFMGSSLWNKVLLKRQTEQGPVHQDNNVHLHSFNLYLFLCVFSGAPAVNTEKCTSVLLSGKEDSRRGIFVHELFKSMYHTYITYCSILCPNSFLYTNHGTMYLSSQ